ncbi:MAG TPA: alpha/beta hydrolase [Solirubrobacteraceae bacterium]|nr:alpha/beta hydrolase [Solirubrobacteraceae bacterium]
MTQSTLSLPDGRQLELFISGPVDGMALIFHHGTPASRLPERAIEAAAHARGWRYVSASRPGYGASTRAPGRRVVDCVSDTAAILAALGVGACVVAGHSGGGPHALACAARLAGVRATLVIAGVAPFGLPDLDFLAGMGEDNHVEFGHARSGEAALRPYLEHERRGLLGVDAAGIVAAMGSLLPEVDRAVLDDEIGADMVAGFAEGLRQGVDGWLDDDLAFVQPWGFPLAAISAPVTLWQGGADLMVPYAHGEWLARAIPGVDAHLLPAEGHLSISSGQAEAMLDALARLARLARLA